MRIYIFFVSRNSPQVRQERWHMLTLLLYVSVCRLRFDRPYKHKLGIGGQNGSLILTVHQQKFQQQGFASTGGSRPEQVFRHRKLGHACRIAAVRNKWASNLATWITLLMGEGRQLHVWFGVCKKAGHVWSSQRRLGLIDVRDHLRNHTNFLTEKQNVIYTVMCIAVWDSSIVLSKYFERHPQLVEGKRCLDLSAGCGLVGLVLCKLGSDVVATDLKENLPLLQRNFNENGM